MTTCSATSEDKVVKLTIFCFQWSYKCFCKYRGEVMTKLFWISYFDGIIYFPNYFYCGWCANIVSSHWCCWCTVVYPVLLSVIFHTHYPAALHKVQLFSNSSWTSTSGGHLSINTLRPRQHGRHFADDTFKCFFLFLNENVWISINISLKFVPKVPIYNILALVQIMA